jgi:hypothetical protein
MSSDVGLGVMECRGTDIDSNVAQYGFDTFDSIEYGINIIETIEQY